MLPSSPPHPAPPQVSGFHWELWSVLADSLNVTSELVQCPTFGKMGAGGVWSGMVGMVQNATLDLTMSSMTTTIERSFALDFLKPVAVVYYALATFLYRDLAGGPLAVFNDVSAVISPFFLTNLLASSKNTNDLRCVP